jgi:hypothetical protein
MTQKRATSVAFFILIALSLGYKNMGLASDAVYKCGDTFTNDSERAKREKCPLLESGAVVTIPTQKKAVSVMQNRSTNLSKPSSLKPKQGGSERSAEQQARDHDSKAIIQTELKKTETQLNDLRRQFASLSDAQDVDKRLTVKQQIARAEADVVSLKRELQR